MDQISQKPEQNQELCQSLCGSGQGTDSGTVGTMGVTGGETRELQHPPREGHRVSACGGGKNSIKPPGSCCSARAVSHTVPLAWQSIGHGLLQLLPAWQGTTASPCATFSVTCSAVPSSPHRLLRHRSTAQPGPLAAQCPGAAAHREFPPCSSKLHLRETESRPPAPACQTGSRKTEILQGCVRPSRNLRY